MKSVPAIPRAVEWIGALDGYLRLIDQTRLPTELVYLNCRDAESVRSAIVRLSVRGAPAIGIAAAMGVVLGVRDFPGDDVEAFLHRVDEVGNYLAAARPTAVNLSWAVERMRRTARAHARSSPECLRVNVGDRALTIGTSSHPSEVETASVHAATRIEKIKQRLLEEARAIRGEDAAMCRAIGEHALPLIRDGMNILTHCNAGSLATAELGTALAPIYLAASRGRRVHVFATETRPLLQGSRLTAWELRQAGIDVTLLCDGMVGSLLSSGRIDLVITGADRIAANGDVANKIGTYSIAVLARAHEIPFYVAAPGSTFDLSMASGADIPIEFREADEVRKVLGTYTAPPDVPCYCPAFDVTPARLIQALITEGGIIEPVTTECIAAMVPGITGPGEPCRDTQRGP